MDLGKTETPKETPPMDKGHVLPQSRRAKLGLLRRPARQKWASHQSSAVLRISGGNPTPRQDQGGSKPVRPNVGDLLRAPVRSEDGREPPGPANVAVPLERAKRSLSGV